MLPEVICFGESLGLVAAEATAPGSSSSPATLTFAGAESNIAIGLARLGIRTASCCAVGKDWFGEAIQRSLRAEKIDTSLLKVFEGARTGLMIKQPQVLSEPSVVYYRDQSAFAVCARELAESIPLHPETLLFVSGITPALGPEVQIAFVSLVRRAAAAGMKIAFDMNYRSRLWAWKEARAVLRPVLHCFDTVFFSESEAAQFTGCSTGFSDSARNLLDAGVRRVIIKRGGEGATYFDASTRIDAAVYAIPFVVDPIGAGDAFNAGFMAGCLKGYPLEKSLRLGTILGAAACSFIGDWEGLPLLHQVERLLDGSTESAR